MRIRNPFGGPALDVTVLLGVGALVYWLYTKHKAATAAALAASAAAATPAQPQDTVLNQNPGDAYFTGGASQMMAPSLSGVRR